jgi:hypothetical protein
MKYSQLGAGVFSFHNIPNFYQQSTHINILATLLALTPSFFFLLSLLTFYLCDHIFYLKYYFKYIKL